MTYTLGFSAAILVGGLAYFYAKRALRKIEQRAQAQEQEAVVPPARLQGDTLIPIRQKSGLPNFQEGLIRQQSQEPMLAQQYTSMLRTASGDSSSPISSASRSPSHRRLLSPTHRFAADIETTSRSV